MAIISIVVAASENNVIGKDNQLLWHLPDDFKFFKAQTINKVIVMGRKTFESIGNRALPKRINVVISRNANFEVPEEVVLVDSLEAAIRKYQKEEEICIIGGEQIYTIALPLVNIIYITRVHTELDGDTYFPEIPTNDFILEAEEWHPQDEKHAFSFTFQKWVRKNG